VEAGGAEALAEAMVNRLAAIAVAAEEEDTKEDTEEDTKAEGTEDTEAEDTEAEDTEVD